MPSQIWNLGWIDEGDTIAHSSSVRFGASLLLARLAQA